MLEPVKLAQKNEKNFPSYQFTVGIFGNLLISSLYVGDHVALILEYGLSYCPDNVFFKI